MYLKPALQITCGIDQVVWPGSKLRGSSQAVEFRDTSTVPRGSQNFESTLVQNDLVLCDGVVGELLVVVTRQEEHRAIVDPFVLQDRVFGLCVASGLDDEFHVSLGERLAVKVDVVRGGSRLEKDRVYDSADTYYGHLGLFDCQVSSDIANGLLEGISSHLWDGLLGAGC